MDCVNHTGVNATAYCQSCGKALCAACIRNAAAAKFFVNHAGRRGTAINSPSMSRPRERRTPQRPQFSD